MLKWGMRNFENWKRYDVSYGIGAQKGREALEMLIGSIMTTA
jgi:hypothetical protein